MYTGQSFLLRYHSGTATMITVVNVRKKQTSDFPSNFVHVGWKVGVVDRLSARQSLQADR